MFCQRCKGLLVRETFSDMREEMANLYPATRCLNCGYIEDPVIRDNRLSAHDTKRSAPRLLNKSGSVLLIKTHSEACGAI